MGDLTPERASIRCDRHPDRLAVRYRASDRSRACPECVLSDATSAQDGLGAVSDTTNHPRTRIAGQTDKEQK